MSPPLFLECLSVGDVVLSVSFRNHSWQISIAGTALKMSQDVLYLRVCQEMRGRTCTEQVDWVEPVNCRVASILKQIKSNCLIKSAFSFQTFFSAVTIFGYCLHSVSLTSLTVSSLVGGRLLQSLSYRWTYLVVYTACMTSKYKCHLNRYKIRHTSAGLTFENHLTNTEQVPCLVHKNTI